jgi:predicted RNA-binding protein YlxR (DUF448 family)
MIRAGRDVGGQWYVGRGNGRGVWWCQESNCSELLQVGHLARALKSAVREADLKDLLALLDGREKLAVPAVVEE